MNTFESALVTGAGGFIGRHLVAQLLEEDIAVVALMLPGEAVPAQWGERVRIVTGDVRALAGLAEAVGKVDVVFHLAAVVSDWGSEALHVDITVGGTRQAIELALDFGAQLVLTSSVCAYASALAKGTLREDTPLGKPAAPYEFCKQEQERVTREAVLGRDLRATIIRPGNVFGVGSGPWVDGMVEMLRAGKPVLPGSGDWDAGLCHVKNLVALMILAARSDYSQGEVFNAADGFGVTWNTYLHRLAHAAGAPAPRRMPNWLARALAPLLELGGRLLRREERPPITRQSFRLLGGPNDFAVDKARECLGYRPVVNFEQGMHELATHFGGSPVEVQPEWVWVTGSGSGLGRYLTGQLLQKGYRVLATDRNRKALEAAAAEDGWPEDRCTLEPLDVAVLKQWRALLARCEEDGVRFSHLLNVAGIIRPGVSFDNPAKDVGAQVRVNLIGTVNGCDTLLPHFSEQGAGHIINIASLAGFGPVPGIVGYCTSKTAVRSFSNGLAMDLAVADSPVRVSCVCPDLIATPMMDQQVQADDHSRIVFSGDRPLTTAEVGALILGRVWREQPMETAIPRSRGLTARVMGLNPQVALWGARRLEQKGRDTLARLRAP